MITANDNPGQGNRGGQEYGEGNFHKSQRNQDSQRHQTTTEEEKSKQQQDSQTADGDNDDEKFSPGEAEGYDPDDFATD